MNPINGEGYMPDYLCLLSAFLALSLSLTTHTHTRARRVCCFHTSVRCCGRVKKKVPVGLDFPQLSSREELTVRLWSRALLFLLLSELE